MKYLLVFGGFIFIGLLVFLIGNQILVQKYYWGPSGPGRFKKRAAREARDSQTKSRET